MNIRGLTTRVRRRAASIGSRVAVATPGRAQWSRIALLAMLLVVGVLGGPRPESPAAAAMRVRWGYYVGYDKPTSLPSLRAHAADLTHVSPHYNFMVDAAGRLTGADDPEATGVARAAGAKVLPLVQNSARYDAFHTAISDPATRRNMVSAISGMVVANRYDGVNIDFEAVNADDRPYLTSFMAELYADMHPKGKLVTIAVAAKTRDVTTGWGGSYDYKALPPNIDYVVTMAYDFHYPGGDAGAVAPVDWMRDHVRFALSEFGPAKLIVGMPLYGYDWNVTTGANATAVKYRQIAELRTAYGAQVGYDKASESGWAKYQKNGQDHEVWFDNGRSFDAKLAAARSLGAAGVAVWRLGQEDPRIWNSLRGVSVGVSLDSFSPNADGYNDVVSASYRIENPATVRAYVINAEGKLVRTLLPPTAQSAGVGTVKWDGLTNASAVAPDGRYTIRVASTIVNSPVTDEAYVNLDTSVTGMTLSTRLYSPNEPPLSASFTLTSPGRTVVQVVQGARVVKTLSPSGYHGVGEYSYTWNGRTTDSLLASEGGYAVRVIATTAIGRSYTYADIFLDRRPPIVSNARPSNPRYFVNGATTQVWTYNLAENSTVEVSLLRFGRPVHTVPVGPQKAGVNQAGWTGYIGGALAGPGAYTYRLTATDAAGNKFTTSAFPFTITQ